MEEQPTYANQALVKASDLIVLSRDFKQMNKVIKVRHPKKLTILFQNYDKVGKKYLSIALIKSNAKDLFFKALLCYLANEDSIGAKKAMQDYQIEDPNFDGSREQ